MKVKLLFALCLAAGLPLPAGADSFSDHLVKPGYLVVTGAPYGSANMVDAEGKPSGFDVDLAEQLAKDLNLKIEHQLVDWSGVLPGLISGRYDMALSSITKSEARVAADEFILSANYGMDGLGLVVRADDDAITSWESACGKAVGFVAGAIEKSLADSKMPDGCFANASFYPGPPEALLDLKNKRIEAFVTGYTVGSWFARSSEGIKVKPDILSSYPIAAAISKSNPALATEVDTLIRRYISDGTLPAIFEKYGIALDWPKIESLPPIPSK